MTNKQLREDLEQAKVDTCLCDVVYGGCWDCSSNVYVSNIAKNTYVGICPSCGAMTSRGSRKQILKYVKELKDYADACALSS